MMKREHFLIAADALADVGNWFVHLVLVDLFVFKGTDPLLNVALMALIQQVPSILLTPLAGIVIHPFNAGRWLAAIIVLKIILAGAIGFSRQTWVMMLLYLFFVSTSSCFAVCRMVMARTLVPPDRLVAFNGLNERVSVAGAMAAPIVAGYVVAGSGKGAALLCGLLMFLFSFGAGIGLLKAGGCSKMTEGHDLFGKHLKNRSVSTLKMILSEDLKMGRYFILFGLVLAGGGLLNITLPLLFKARFGGDVSGWGFAMALYQAGSIAAALLVSRYFAGLGEKKVLFAAFFVLALSMAGLGPFTSLFLFCLLVFASGAGFTLIHLILESLVQKNSPVALVGRLISFLIAFKGICYLGITLGGVMALSVTGPAWLLITGAAVFFSAGTLCLKSDKIPSKKGAVLKQSNVR